MFSFKDVVEKLAFSKLKHVAKVKKCNCSYYGSPYKDDYFCEDIRSLDKNNRKKRRL